MKTIYVSGVFDLFHYGHLRLLKKCEEIAYTLKRTTREPVRLLIGVCNDKDCEKYKRKPIMTMNERASSIIEIFELLGQRGIFVAVLLDAPLVDTHELYEEKEIVKVLHDHSESEDEQYAPFYTVAIEMGIFQRLEYTGGISTSDIIDRVIESTYETL
jgi:choline-phosphate cytidylyltransferase